MEVDTVRDGQAPSKVASSGEVILSGDFRYTLCKKMQRIFTDGANTETLEPRTHRTVVNDKYSAYWAGTQSSLPIIVDHPSIASMAPEVADELRQHGDERIEELAFGTSEERIGKIYGTGKERRWQLSEGTKDGDKIFTVTAGSVDKAHADIVTHEWEIDADKGFLITAFKVYRAENVVGFVRSINPKRDSASGFWFPENILDTTYRSFVMKPTDDLASPRAKEVYRERTIKVDTVGLNVSVPPEQFTVKALDIPNGTNVARKLLDGRKTVFIMSNGIALPQPVYQDVRAASRPTVSSTTVDELAHPSDSSVGDSKSQPHFIFYLVLLFTGLVGLAAGVATMRRWWK
jgi:hypothetical protein